MAKPEDLAEELEVVLDYAQLDLEFTIEAGSAEGTSVITMDGETYPVNTDLALDNIKETPDRATKSDVTTALKNANPALTSE